MGGADIQTQVSLIYKKILFPLDHKTEDDIGQVLRKQGRYGKRHEQSLEVVKMHFVSIDRGCPDP